MSSNVLELVPYDAADVVAALGGSRPNYASNELSLAFAKSRRTRWGQRATRQNAARALGVVPTVNRTLDQGGARQPATRQFDPITFLSTIGEGRKSLILSKKQGIFTQGDPADSIFYIQKGRVRLTVVSKIGKEAIIGLLNEGSFFGEGSLAGQPLRMGSAEAMTDCRLLRIDKKAMMDVLHQEPAFSEMFMTHLLARNIRYEEDLVDQLFNSSEKRLARVLLLLTHFDTKGEPQTVVPKISQETLAEMVGTTRSRVSFFMNRFRKLGFIHYTGGSEGGLQIHSSLLNIVLHD